MKPKKLIERKEVEYFGMKLLVQTRMTYITVDLDGDMYAFTHRPIPQAYGRWEEGSDGYKDTDLEFLGTVKLEKGEDWRETLRKI